MGPVELTPIIIYSTEEVFAGSVLLDVTPGQPYYRTEVPEEGGLTGVIYFSGIASGYAAIHMSIETAHLVADDYLFGEDLEITAEVVEDIIGEVANILAGRVKSYIDPPGSNLQISLPEINRGSDFLPAAVPDANKITVPFNLDEGGFWVEVQLAQ